MNYIRKILRSIKRKVIGCRTYYFVDFENVRSKALLALNDINKGDVFIIFYSDNSGELSFEMMNYIYGKKARIKSFKASVGTSNALDFQLSSYLGYLINDKSDSKFYIVSNDKGYDCLCRYWNDLGYDVARISIENENVKIKGKKKKKKIAKQIKTDKVSMKEITKYLDAGEDTEEILQLFNASSSKQEFNIKLSKKYRDNKKSSEVYNKLKPLVNVKF
jgi:hypothetical protein